MLHRVLDAGFSKGPDRKPACNSAQIFPDSAASPSTCSNKNNRLNEESKENTLRPVGTMTACST
jgi:hypothetical protein